MSIFWSIMVFFVVVILNALLIRFRGRRKINTWSIADFLPIVAFVFLGLGAAWAIEFLLGQLFKIDKQILNDGGFSIRQAIGLSITFSSIQWYKTSPQR